MLALQRMHTWKIIYHETEFRWYNYIDDDAQRSQTSIMIQMNSQTEEIVSFDENVC
jgi:hypothetical protein